MANHKREQLDSAPWGVLVLDKPIRMSSARAVADLRRRAEAGCGRSVKTGHAGTLDPLATGVLVVVFGQATKIAADIMRTDKRYETRIDLSAFTSTDDQEGERSDVEVARAPTQGDIRTQLKTFTGRIAQSPPAFSAVKIDGVRAYKLGRRGRLVEPAAREVLVHRLELVKYEWPLVDLLIHCAKGFYVRSLARDLGRALGTGGHCVVIRRTAVGPFTLDEARGLDAIAATISQSDLISIDELVARLGRRLGGGQV
ncbi:MAG: tRNA pseudouridine(55) synthase TruB [Phycisphaerales bacterium]|nr:tRNA pseudouridine(55) synthase TruB [Phycisphaerales bacterium]MCI0630479.1 tRNA pseudouridine(55) synthase TruB [Phycisphaerales bacterium]MCI0674229.1 tRNA pseudouridine(55) synthase TruB [Phycisphaerales bacterium]